MRPARRLPAETSSPRLLHACRRGCPSKNAAWRWTPICCYLASFRSARAEDDMLLSEVLWVDHFGNAQLNVDPAEVAPFGDVVSVRFGGVGTGPPQRTGRQDLR